MIDLDGFLGLQPHGSVCWLHTFITCQDCFHKRPFLHGDELAISLLHTQHTRQPLLYVETQEVKPLQRDCNNMRC